jgi:hypothetical protein
MDNEGEEEDHQRGSVEAKGQTRGFAHCLATAGRDVSHLKMWLPLPVETFIAGRACEREIYSLFLTTIGTRQKIIMTLRLQTAVAVDELARRFVSPFLPASQRLPLSFVAKQ